MQVEELLAQARETFGARREYGEPYERNGITIIPASSVRGGGGGGTDHDGDGGGGFGITARPSGAWVIRGDEVTWRPAVDPLKIVLGLELVAAIAFLRAPRRRPRRLPLRGAARARALRRAVRHDRRRVRLPLR